ncbi:MAG TPA: polysaccharide deacetylase [Planctomycetaceae bacterium]|nr:polysaccharide deacetylase [Planctomycetaceae bacterium]
MLLVNKLVPIPKKQLLASVMRSSGMNAVLHRLPTWSGLLVVNYHRIGQSAACPFDQNLFSATSEGLELQLKQYKRHADVIRISELDEVLKRRTGKSVLITFDDGYRDNYDLAFPVLKAADVPATFFVATGFVDQPRIAWWDEIAWMVRQSKVNKLPGSVWFPEGLIIPEQDRSSALGAAVRKYWTLTGNQTELYLNDLAKQTQAGRCPAELAEKMWMTWEMMQEMSDSGMDFGGHTVDHPILAQHSGKTQRLEVFESRARLIEKLGIEPQAFAYPVGQAHMFSSETKHLLKEAGYKYGFSFYGNYESCVSVDPYDIPRCAIDFNMPQAIFESRLSLPQIFAKK